MAYKPAPSVTRRVAIAGIAAAASGGGAATSLVSSVRPVETPAAPGSRLLASQLGVRGDNTLADTERAQRAIEAAARAYRTLHFEGQHEWVFRKSLTLFGSEDEGSTMLRGEGAYATIIRCSDPAVPVFVNDAGPRDFRRLSIRGLTIRGGSRGLSICRRDEQVASLFDLSDVRFELQNEIALFCDQYLLSSSFTDVVFYYCNRGIYCGRNVNNVLFVKPRFEGLNDRAVEFASPGMGINGCEDVRFVSPRFEGRNREPVDGAFVIGGYRLSTLTVEGGYFEDTHATILRERGGLGQVVFRNCHFSGQASDGGRLQAEIFDSESIVTLDGNRFVNGTQGPRHLLVAGVNRGLDRKLRGSFTEYGGALRFISGDLPLGDAPTSLARLSWNAWAGPQDRRSASMTAEVTISILTDGGRTGVCQIFRYDLLLFSLDGESLQGRLSSPRQTGGSDHVALRMGDGAVSILLLPNGKAKGESTAKVDIRGSLHIQREPPFMVE